MRGTINRITGAALLLAGTICILFADKLFSLLPFIIGIPMVSVAAVFFALSVIRKEYNTLETSHTAGAIVVLVMGVMILINGSESIGVIAVTWGIFGLVRGTKELNHAIYKFCRKEKFTAMLLRSCTEIVLAALLMFRPFQKITVHIVILGAELILMSARFFVGKPEREPSHEEFY